MTSAEQNKLQYGIVTLLKVSNLSAFFIALLALVTIYFVYWGLGYTNYSHVTLFTLATLFGIFMAFNIGGNDVANSFGTSVGAGRARTTPVGGSLFSGITEGVIVWSGIA